MPAATTGGGGSTTTDSRHFTAQEAHFFTQLLDHRK
jgi:hypothetical protein